MAQTNAQLIGELLANQKQLLKSVDDLKDTVAEQRKEILELKLELSNLKAGGRVLLWVAGTLGAALGLVSTWAWRIWQASQ